MTEADEVAENMYADYIQWRDARYRKGLLGSSPHDYVTLKLSATESYTLMNAVSNALEHIVYWRNRCS